MDEHDGYPERHREKWTARTLTKEKKNCEIVLKFWDHILVDAVTLLRPFSSNNSAGILISKENS
jgi:hypothetical protein